MKLKVLITVKTYPSLSAKYDEVVCTAGVLESGEWVRLYPIPFRKLDYDRWYKKYQWLEIEAERNTSDFRPESFRPKLKSIKFIGQPLPTTDHWISRKKYVLKNYYTSLTTLIAEAKNPKNISLATFKPTKVLDFSVEKAAETWPAAKIKKVMAERAQMKLFKDEFVREELNIIEKIPYNFYYHFEDDAGNRSKQQIQDWEIYQLYRNCLKRSQNEHTAIDDVIKKYKTSFITNKDLYFFLGTTKAHHHRSKNPFTIIGVFYPPKLASARVHPTTPAPAG